MVVRGEGLVVRGEGGRASDAQVDRADGFERGDRGIRLGLADRAAAREAREQCDRPEDGHVRLTIEPPQDSIVAVDRETLA